MIGFSIYYKNKVYTSSEIINKINNTLEYFIIYDIKKGDRVAIISSNSLDYVILTLALIKAEIIFIPLNIRLNTSQIKSQLNELNCNKIFCSSNYYDIYLQLMPAYLLSTINDCKANKQYINNLEYFTNPSAKTLKNITNIILSSGSSASPKYIVHDYSNHYFSALGSNENIKLNANSKCLLTLPLFHVGGLGVLFRSLIAGSNIIITYAKEIISDCIIKTKPSNYSFVFSQYEELISNKTVLEIFKNADAILLGGSSIPHNLIKYSNNNKIPIYTSYGSSEMSSQITTTFNSDLNNILTSGNILNYRSIKIDEEGEILLKGKTLFKGYLINNKLIKLTDDNGWFHSGDIGRLDPEGRLILIGRKDNMFISGGENIHPEKIENELLNIKGVINCCVIAVDNNIYGKRPECLIKLDKPRNINEIKEILYTKIAKYEMPDEYYYFPKELDNQFKIDRKKALEMYKNNELIKIID